MARKRRRSYEELEQEIRFLNQYHVSNAWASFLNNLTRWGGLSFITYWIYRAIESLAGKETIADVVVKFIGNLTISQGAAYVLGGAGLAYGVAQKKLRQKTVERLQPRVQELEERLDPNRTTSDLTPKGETNPADRD
jgi:hypothetical protein